MHCFMILFTIGLGVNTDASLKLSVASIFLFELSFGASWCGLPWIYVVSVASVDADSLWNESFVLFLKI